MKTRNIAIILAGGVGERMRQDKPKQLLKVAGKSIIEHTVFALHENSDIDEILILMTPGHIEEIRELSKNYNKVIDVIEGGGTRSETSKKAIGYIDSLYDDEECNLLFHDAVRPFVSNRIISDCVRALDSFTAVDVVIPSADTIIETDGEVITSIPDRSRLRRGQTPQAFKISTIKKAYEISEKDDDFKSTDDCGVVLKYLPDTPIKIVEGDESNIKVTHPLDLMIADRIFQTKLSSVEVLDDVSRKSALEGKTLVVFGGSYGIGADIARMSESYGANVYSFSRSGNGVDITSSSSVEEALKGVHEESGRIDFIVNTAGQLTISPISDMSVEDINESVGVNYIAPIMLAKMAYPYLKETNGHLLMFTSSSYTRGRKNYSLYSSSKAATVNLTQALSEEWYEDGISVNCINPERTATPMRTKAFGEEDPEKLLKSEQVASASIDTIAGNVTGQVVDVRIGSK